MSLFCLCAFVTLNKRLLTYLLNFRTRKYLNSAARLDSAAKQQIPRLKVRTGCEKPWLISITELPMITYDTDYSPIFVNFKAIHSYA